MHPSEVIRIIEIYVINIIILRCRLYHPISRIYGREDDQTRAITKKRLRGTPTLEPHFSYARIRSILDTSLRTLEKVFLPPGTGFLDALASLESTVVGE